MNWGQVLIAFLIVCTVAYWVGDRLGKAGAPKDAKPECIFIAGPLTPEQIAEGMTQMLKQGNCNSVRLVK